MKTKAIEGAIRRENARLIEACCDVRLSLGQSFESMEKRDLLAIIGEAERIIEAALSDDPSGKVLVDREKLLDIEWDNRFRYDKRCPACLRVEADGHTPTCWLAELLEAPNEPHQS